MEYFSECPLTATGTPRNYEGEFLLAAIDNVTILKHDKKPTPYVRGLLTVTTHRFVWIDASRKMAMAAWVAHLPVDRPLEDKSSPLRARAMVRFGLGLRLEFEGGGKDRDRFLSVGSQSIARKEWEKIARAKAAEVTKEQQSQYRAPALGVHGIEKRVVKHNAERNETISTGFASLENLRHQAADLVKIAEAFRNTTKGADVDNELLNMMAEMGIQSPVTKESTGGNVRLYREQLARQVADFLRVPILNVGGVLTTSDAYCLVMRNRATTELVSPEDFQMACNYFEKLQLPIQVTRLESGVAALEVDASLDRRGAETLRTLAEERNSVTALDLVRIRNIPIQRAQAMLEDAEQHGYLARDETTEGLRFFPNLFSNFLESSSKQKADV